MKFLNLFCFNIFYFKRNSNCIRQHFAYLYLTPIIILFLCNLSYSQKSVPIFGGTTVLGILRNDTAWIAADSKKINQLREPGPLECKIFVSPNFVFTHTGIETFRDSTENKYVEIYSLVRQCASNSKTISGAVNLFTKRIIPTLKYSWKFMAKNIANVPTSWLIRHMRVDAIFIGYQQGEIVCFYNSYTAFLDKDDRVQVNFSPHLRYHKRGDPFTVLHFGKVDAIKPHLFDDTTSAPPIILRRLIGMEIKAHPGDVGEPINIIRIDKSGFHWIDKHQPCK